MIDTTILPLDITQHIRTFRNFLNAAWPNLDALMEAHDWDEDGGFTVDWIQVNWELLVERELLGKENFLAPLEWNNRITFPEKHAKYKVICKIPDGLEIKDWILKSNNYEGEELLISGFCTPRGISYGLYPPFDFVELCSPNKKKIYIIPIDSCRFFLNSILP